jgi:hypothetical protein
MSRSIRILVLCTFCGPVDYCNHRFCSDIPHAWVARPAAVAREVLNTHAPLRDVQLLRWSHVLASHVLHSNPWQQRLQEVAPERLCALGVHLGGQKPSMSSTQPMHRLFRAPGRRRRSVVSLAVTTASLIASSTPEKTASDNAKRHRRQDCACCPAEQQRRSRARRQSALSHRLEQQLRTLSS